MEKFVGPEEERVLRRMCHGVAPIYLIGAADVAASWIVEPMVTQLMWPAKADKVDYVSLRNVAAVTWNVSIDRYQCACALAGL